MLPRKSTCPRNPSMTIFSNLGSERNTTLTSRSTRMTRWVLCAPSSSRRRQRTRKSKETPSRSEHTTATWRPERFTDHYLEAQVLFTIVWQGSWPFQSVFQRAIEARFDFKSLWQLRGKCLTIRANEQVSHMQLCCSILFALSFLSCYLREIFINFNQDFSSLTHSNSLTTSNTLRHYPWALSVSNLFKLWLYL